MSRHYKHPCLLIEFHPDKAFCLQNALEIEPEIRIGNIATKLSILVLAYLFSLLFPPSLSPSLSLTPPLPPPLSPPHLPSPPLSSPLPLLPCITQIQQHAHYSLIISFLTTITSSPTYLPPSPYPYPPPGASLPLSASAVVKIPASYR